MPEMHKPKPVQVDSAKWLSPSQAARVLDVTTDRIRQMALEGKLLYEHTPNGRLYDRVQVERLAADWKASGHAKRGPKRKEQQ